MSIFSNLSALASKITSPFTTPYKVSYQVKPTPTAQPKVAIPSPTPVLQKPTQAAVQPTGTAVQPPSASPTPGPIPGFHPAGRPNDVPANYVPLINQYAQQYNVPAPLLAAHAYHETAGTFNPQSVGPTGDYGLAQIVLAQHPEITKAQAFDPNFALNFMANKLASDNKYFGGDWNRTIAAYNTGRGGGAIKGVNPYGGGPRGQQYINNVTNNLTPELLKQLGIKRGDPIWKDIRGYPILKN